MVKARKPDIDSALTSLDRRYRAVLIFGPDEGLVRERADQIARQIVDDPGDPFNAATLNADAIKAEPSRLADELAAMSMTGGRRLVRVNGAVDGIRQSVAAALEAPAGDNLLLLQAGELSARSSLRQMAEKAADILAIACYEDSATDLEALIRQMTKEAGLSIAGDALAYLGEVLGDDRQVTRRELEKLILYKDSGEQEDRQITLEDARACIGDGASATVFEIASAITGGEVARLDHLLDRAFMAGENPVGILRILARRLQQMHVVTGHMSQGLERRQAVGKLTPRLFFKEKDRFLSDLDFWTRPRIATAIDRVLEAESDCKSSGLPAETLCRRLCLQLAAFARRGRRRAA